MHDARGPLHARTPEMPSTTLGADTHLAQMCTTIGGEMPSTTLGADTHMAQMRTTIGGQAPQAHANTVHRASSPVIPPDANRAAPHTTQLRGSHGQCPQRPPC
jgi:hypothetical protein